MKFQISANQIMLFTFIALILSILNSIELYGQSDDDILKQVLLQRETLPGYRISYQDKPLLSDINKTVNNSSLQFGSASNTIRAALTKISPSIRINDIRKTSSPHLYEVLIDVGSFYVTSDGRYVIKNGIFDVISKIELPGLGEDRASQKVKQQTTPASSKPKLASKVSELELNPKYFRDLDPEIFSFIKKNFDESHYISYKAKNQKHEMFTFADPTCPRCREFHRKIDELNENGVTVNYLPFPLGASTSKGYKLLDQIYCNKDQLTRKSLLDVAMKNRSFESECSGGTKLVANTKKYLMPYIGSGTPRSVTDTNVLVIGNIPVKEIVASLAK